MNKLLKSIVAATVGVAMAIGVGVGVASRESKAAYADSYTISCSERATTLGWSNSVAYTEWESANNVFTITATGGGNNGKWYTSGGGSWRMYSGGTVTISCSSAYIISTVASSPSCNWTIASNNLSASFSPSARTDFTSFTITYSSASGPTVTNVELEGSMTTKSYNTAQAWNNDGLDATVTMNNGSQYLDDIGWEYDPTTPAAAVIANSNEPVSNISVKATALAGGKSDSVTTTGISVSIATVAQGLAAIPDVDDEIDGAIVRGTISYISEIGTSYNNATYFISDDGTRTNELEVFRGKGLNNVNITNSDDLQVGDVVLVYGNLKYFSDQSNSIKEFTQGNYLLKLDRPVSVDPSITITENNFSMGIGDDDVTVHATAENIPDGGSVIWESSSTSVATVSYDNVNEVYKVHAVAAGEATITASILNSEDEVVVSDSITVTVVAPLLSIGDAVIFYHDTYYLADINTSGNNHYGNQTLVKGSAVIYTVVTGSESGSFGFEKDGSYLSWSSGNTLDMAADINGHSSWLVTGTSLTSCSITNVSDSSRALQYNSQYTRFACYTSSQGAVSLEKVDGPIVSPEVDEVTVIGDAAANANGATSITKDFLYEVTYVDENNEGESLVSVSVLNSQGTTSGVSETTEPLNGSFSVTFTKSDTYTITVTSLEDDTKSDSTSIVVSNIYVPETAEYQLYEGSVVSGETVLVDGDYVIYYGGAVMNATIEDARAQYDEAESAGTNLINIPVNANVIWHISASGDYYTIYNATEAKYLASTGAKNKAQLLEDGTDDKALWSVTISEGKFEFVNKANTAAGVNANLRRNTTYGFACYAAGTGGSLSLYKKTANEILKPAIGIKKIDGNVTVNGSEQVTAVNSLSVRFGVKIPVGTWDALSDYGYEVQEFGIKMFLSKSLNGVATVASRGDNVKTVSKSASTPDLDGLGNYNFLVVVNIPDVLPTTNEFDHDTYFCVRPYVKIDNQIVWLLGEDMHESMETLLDDNSGTNLSINAIAFLKNQWGM